MFRDLHDNDPLQRKFDQPKLTIKGLFQNRPFSSASSVAPFSSYRTSAAPMSCRSSSYRPGSGVARPANVTEAVDEGDEAELAEGQNDEEYVEGIGQLEEVLQVEAEILASELEQAEQEGVDASILQDLEHGIEAAAGALVTMREARQGLVIVRGDRGYMASWEMEAKVVARNPRRFPLGRWQPVPQSWSWWAAKVVVVVVLLLLLWRNQQSKFVLLRLNIQLP